MNNLGDLLKLIKYPSLTEKSINFWCAFDAIDIKSIELI